MNILPWVILAMPLLGFTVLALVGDRIKGDERSRLAGWFPCAMVFVSFALSLVCLTRLLALPPADGGLRQVQPYLGFEWMEAGGFKVPMSLLVDPLSAVMLLVVTGVGFLIHVYSVGYMSHDDEQPRYFSYLNLFTFFMLLLVLAGNLPLMFVGWEGVGLCSYLLIGFWFKKKSASDAGNKAFIVNRIGDAGLIVGMVLMFHAFGTLDFVEIASGARTLAAEGVWQFGAITVACLLLFVGACGKSAQIPLHVWLPDAMEGPTPVSALIHAATMVTAGVYMVARLAPLFSLSPTAMGVVAVVGTGTALMAATIALVQTDIKRVLAYSTVSQLGYMFLAAGVGAFGVAVFHLFTHAFFKALLFLGSGSVIHAMGGEQDMRRMGGLWRRIPWTFATFVAGWLAIMGIWGFSGYFSKDAILLSAYGEHKWVFVVGLLTAMLTAFYMSRLVFLTFFGRFRGGHEAEHRLHESPWVMLLPLVLLAIGSAFAGYIQVPEFLHPVFRLPEHHEPDVGWVPLLANLGAIAAAIAAYWLYVRTTGVPARVRESAPAAHRTLESKYYWDEAFDGFAANVVVKGSDKVLWRNVDASFIDGMVNGVGEFTREIGTGVREMQTGFVRNYALVLFAGAVAFVGYLLWMR